MRAMGAGQRVAIQRIVVGESGQLPELGARYQCGAGHAVAFEPDIASESDAVLLGHALLADQLEKSFGGRHARRSRLGTMLERIEGVALDERTVQDRLHVLAD